MLSRRLLQVFFTKVAYNLRSEASTTYLSYAWWIMEPVLYVAVYYIVFGVLLLRGTENFLVFLLCGKIPFLWFAKAVSNASDSVRAGRGLIQQVAIPKVFFPMVIVTQISLKECVVFALLVAFLFFSGEQASWNWLFLVPLMAAQFLLICGFALLAAAIIPFIPDVRFIVSTGMTLMLFVSGIFYNYTDILSEEYQALFLLNPVANLIANYRLVLLDGMPPDWQGVAYVALLGVALTAVVTLAFRRLDSTYARLVVE